MHKQQLMTLLTIHPGNGNSLKTRNDEETGSTGTIGVNQLEKDYSSLKHKQLKTWRK